MRILVTGGAGYIGSHLAHEAASLGHDVFVIDSLIKGNRWAVPQGAEFIEADIGDADVVSQILKEKKIEAVFHFAAFTSVPESVEEPQKYFENNTAKSIRLILESIKAQVKYFIFSSTAAVYGEQDQKIVSEEFPLEPISPYGESKLMTEKALQEACLDSSMKYTILRYFNVAGASLKFPVGQATESATHLIKVAAEVASHKRSHLEVYGTDYGTPDGTCIRDYIHVDDLVEAHIKALDHLSKNGKSDIFNCGYQKGYSVNDVVETMKSVSKNNFKVQYLPRRKGDIEQLIANTEKIRRVLGFQPQNDNLELICQSAYDWELKLKKINEENKKG